MDCIDHGQKGSRDGYGRVRFNGIVTGPHRRAYCIANNVTLEDIKGLEIRHMCNNPRCINPAHLDIGTAKDNAQDRERTGKSVRGAGNPAAQRTPAQVLEIRRLYAEGVKQVDIAKRFGVRQGYVSNVVNGRIWKCLA